MWFEFNDMCSGGDYKEKYTHIYIEANNEREAASVFYSKFGHSPFRVSCKCCGADYSINENKYLEQLTGYERGCYLIEHKKDSNGHYIPLPKGMKVYYEKDEEPPSGYALDTQSYRNKYMSLDNYLKSSKVFVLRKKDIPDGWKKSYISNEDED